MLTRQVHITNSSAGATHYTICYLRNFALSHQVTIMEPQCKHHLVSYMSAGQEEVSIA